MTETENIKRWRGYISHILRSSYYSLFCCNLQLLSSGMESICACIQLGMFSIARGLACTASNERCSPEPEAWMQDVKYPLELNHTASTYSPTPPHWRPEEFFNDWIRSVRVTQTGDWDTSTTATVDIYIMFLKLSVWTFISWSVATEYVHCKARPRVVQHWVKILPSPAAVFNVKTSRHRNTAKYEHHGTSLQFKGASVFSWVEMASGSDVTGADCGNLARADTETPQRSGGIFLSPKMGRKNATGEEGVSTLKHIGPTDVQCLKDFWSKKIKANKNIGKWLWILRAISPRIWRHCHYVSLIWCHENILKAWMSEIGTAEIRRGKKGDDMDKKWR